MVIKSLSLEVLPHALGIVSLKTFQIPEWATQSPWYCICKTDEELSIVCCQEYIPDSYTSETGWCALKVRGPLGFTSTGGLSSLASPLAMAHISIFVVSTFMTDYILVKTEKLKDAVHILRAHDMQVNAVF